MTLTPEPPARRAPRRRSLRHLGITTIVFALVATVLALLPSAASASTQYFDGRLVKGATTATHQVAVEKGTVKATLSFTFSPAPRSGTPTAKVTLRRADGTVVASSYGEQPRDVAARRGRRHLQADGLDRLGALEPHRGLPAGREQPGRRRRSGARAGAPEPTPDPQPTPTPTSDPDPSPQTATYTTNGSTTLTTSLGEAVHVRYPTSGGAMAADRPVVLIGHGMGMGSDMNAVMNGGTFLNRAGYVTASANMDAQSSYANKARLMSRVLDAIVDSPALAPGVLPNRVGYYGGSNGAITAVTMQDPAVRDERFDAFVMRSPWHREGNPSWVDAPPILVMLGTADPTVSPGTLPRGLRGRHAPEGQDRARRREPLDDAVGVEHRPGRVEGDVQPVPQRGRQRPRRDPPADRRRRPAALRARLGPGHRRPRTRRRTRRPTPTPDPTGPSPTPAPTPTHRALAEQGLRHLGAPPGLQRHRARPAAPADRGRPEPARCRRLLGPLPVGRRRHQRHPDHDPDPGEGQGDRGQPGQAAVHPVHGRRAHPARGSSTRVRRTTPTRAVARSRSRGTTPPAPTTCSSPPTTPTWASSRPGRGPTVSRCCTCPGTARTGPSSTTARRSARPPATPRTSGCRVTGS